jgi:hypothetical protein
LFIDLAFKLISGTIAFNSLGYAAYAFFNHNVGSWSTVQRKNKVFYASFINTDYPLISYVFLVIPAALMETSGWVTGLFFLSVFALVITTNFCILEALLITIEDTKLGHTLKRTKLSVVLVGLGVLGAWQVFCYNWSFALLDSITGMLMGFILLIAFLQTIAVSWQHGSKEANEISKGSRTVLVWGYFLGLICLPLIVRGQYWADESATTLGTALMLTACWFTTLFLLSLTRAQNSKRVTFTLWYEKVLFSGVNPICEQAYGVTDPNWKFRLFQFWFCLSLKYLMPIGILVSATNYGSTRLYDLLSDELWYNMKWDGKIALPLLAVLLIMILFPLIFEKQAPTGEFEFLMGLKVPENVQTQVAPEDVDLNEKEFKDIIDQDILQRRKVIGPFSFSPLPNEEPNMYAYTNHELKARVKMDDESGWYLGEWKDSKFNGKGILYVGRGEQSLYEGFFLDSKMCGPGRIIHKDGVVIEGTFNKEEKLEGEFTKSFKDGSYYQRSRDEQGKFVDKFFTHEGVEQSCD